MIIKSFAFHLYQAPLITGLVRQGAFIEIQEETGRKGFGDIAPLPKWSQESLDDCLQDLKQKKALWSSFFWSKENCLKHILKLNLLPAASFGLESALLMLLDPPPKHPILESALFMGTYQEILKQAEARKKEGSTFAKLKVGHLDPKEAMQLIHELTPFFKLRVDVNQAWTTKQALDFFSKFPLNTFDYIEEPFQNPHDLHLFSHPLAIDESFPKTLSLNALEALPTLKALIYKPTIQGGLAYGKPLHQWATKRKIQFILSASFESAIGLSHIVSMAKRLFLKNPLGIGTSPYFISK